MQIRDGKREYDHWQDFHLSGVDSPHARAFGDSILPVVKTGQALLVATTTRSMTGCGSRPIRATRRAMS